MKHLVFLLLMLFSISLFAEPSLVLVKDLGEAKFQVPVLDYIENNFLILAEAKDLDFLKKKRFDVTILDESVQDKEYYIVHPFFLSPDESIDYSEKIMQKYGRIVASFDKVLLMESTPEKLHSMTEYRIKLDRLELEPIDFVDRTILNPAAKTTRYRPIIQDMLDRVSPDSVEAFERKLCAFHTRHCRSTASKDEVIPWMRKIYAEYGCDTIVSLKMSGMSDEVVGIRRGKKYPELTKFVLLGGHTDNIISGGSANARHEGGNDNATGQVAVLEACRVHQYYEFDHTIMYCTFNAEETGLNGSKAATRWLKNMGAQTIGGNFSYDMFGMRESNMKFRVYQSNSGAQEFIDKMKQLKSKYNLTQPTAINSTTSSSISSDARNMWSSGFACIGHNFATAGAGRIHSSADKFIESAYDKEFQAETAKLGIITTAEYAGVNATKIINKNPISHNAYLRCIQGANNVIFTFNNKNQLPAGKLEIFTPQGKLIRSLKTDKSPTSVVWDGKNNKGVKVAANAVLVAKYSTPETTTTLKINIK